MKERDVIKGSLDLGKELSKSEQKKILGGVYVNCSNGQSFQMGNTCDGQYGYCEATGRGTTVSCG